MSKLWFFLATTGVMVAHCGCSKSEGSKSDPSQRAAPARGDHVVVEPRASEFFEARVLEVKRDKMKVEQLDTGESHLVAIADAYLLSKSRAELAAGQFAVCKRAAKKWEACQIDQVLAKGVKARSPEGDVFTLKPADALPASPITVLNIRRNFARHKKFREFTAAVAKAGSPAVAAGWRAGPKERVIVRAKEGWFSAQIVEIEDEGYRVRFAADGRDGETARSKVIPEPPYKHVELRQGQFALVRPKTTAGAWRPYLIVRIAEDKDDEVEVEDGSGRKRSVVSRDLVPLRATP